MAGTMNNIMFDLQKQLENANIDMKNLSTIAQKGDSKVFIIYLTIMCIETKVITTKFTTKFVFSSSLIINNNLITNLD